MPTPGCLTVDAGTSVERIGDMLGFPFVLKNARSSKGRLVRLCTGPDDVAIHLAEVAGPGPVLAQRYVAASHGRDIRVIVVGGEPVAAMVRRAPDGALCANIHQGAAAYPTPMTPELADIATRAARALGLDIAGVDVLFDDFGLTVCEVNTSPGLEAIEQVTGRDVAGAIVRHIWARLRTETASDHALPRMAVR